jgi:hypothetical protein
MWNQFHRGEGASATRGGFRRVGVAPVNRISDAVNAFVAEIRIFGAIGTGLALWGYR